MNDHSLDAALDFAIAREREAADFYRRLAAQTTNPSVRKTLETFAEVERGHETKLTNAKNGMQTLAGEGSPLPELKLNDYLSEVEPSPEMSFQDALIVAMKRERAARDLYADLAERAPDETLRALFAQLSREEAGHESTFEDIYERHFLSEN